MRKQKSSILRILLRNEVGVSCYFWISEILHCKLRLEISDLQGDLVKRHLSDNPICQCGYHCENAKHYLFECPLFDAARTTTIKQIDRSDYNLKCLLFGNPNRSLSENVKIFEYVSEFIKLSKRFN